jgi:acetyltransferase-like isoleucine patch superfamily enzyme
MVIRTPEPRIDPLLRNILRMPPSLVRFAPVSASKSLRTVLLRDTVLAQGLNATFDDSCRLTTTDGELDQLNNVKLNVLTPKRVFSDVHLAILSTGGQINLSIGGNDLRVFIGAGCNLRVGIQLTGAPTLFIGDGTTMAQARLLVSQADLYIGDDCQFSEDVLVQCGEQHTITDLATGAALNGGRHRISIARHVWLGRRAMVLPNVSIGEGSIVEAGAVVSSHVAINTWVGGAPAQPLRSNVGWAREPGSPPPKAAPAEVDADDPDLS